MWAQLAPAAQAAAIVLTGAVLLAAACHAPWKSLLRPDRLHWWCAGVLCLVSLRSLDAMPFDGLRLHLLGTTLVYVIFGAPLALLAVGIAGAAICLSGHEPTSAYGCNFLLRGALPIAVAWCVFRAVRARQESGPAMR